MNEYEDVSNVTDDEAYRTMQSRSYSDNGNRAEVSSEVNKGGLGDHYTHVGRGKGLGNEPGGLCIELELVKTLCKHCSLRKQKEYGARRSCRQGNGINIVRLCGFLNKQWASRLEDPEVPSQIRL